MLDSSAFALHSIETKFVPAFGIADEFQEHTMARLRTVKRFRNSTEPFTKPADIVCWQYEQSDVQTLQILLKAD